MLISPSPLPFAHQMAPAPSNLAIIAIRPGKVTCGGEAVQPTSLERPFLLTYGTWPGSSPQTHFRLEFRINATGRPVGISRVIGLDQDQHAYLPNQDDMAAALAASRFTTGQARTSCSITYDAGLEPIAQAAPTVLAELVSTPEIGNARAAWDLLTKNGTCQRGPSGPRAIHYPSFERITQPPGSRGWTFLRFNVDAKGHTRAVRVAYSSGNATLDGASLAALGANRYEPGHAVTGCAYEYHREADRPLPSPEVPADAPAGSEGVACDLDPATVRSLYDGDAYPRAFRLRRIEGYAIIGFDTASWGAVGNVKVLASEPAQPFGQDALQAVLNGRVAPNDNGRRGCVQRVRFQLQPRR